eukprot:scaffold115393_cov63-Phaeocystis_antarctica.AAC.1
MCAPGQPAHLSRCQALRCCPTSGLASARSAPPCTGPERRRACADRVAAHAAAASSPLPPGGPASRSERRWRPVVSRPRPRRLGQQHGGPSEVDGRAQQQQQAEGGVCAPQAAARAPVAERARALPGPEDQHQQLVAARPVCCLGRHVARGRGGRPRPAAAARAELGERAPGGLMAQVDARGRLLGGHRGHDGRRRPVVAGLLALFVVVRGGAAAARRGGGGGGDRGEAGRPDAPEQRPPLRRRRPGRGGAVARPGGGSGGASALLARARPLALANLPLRLRRDTHPYPNPYP